MCTGKKLVLFEDLFHEFSSSFIYLTFSCIISNFTSAFPIENMMLKYNKLKLTFQVIVWFYQLKFCLTKTRCKNDMEKIISNQDGQSSFPTCFIKAQSNTCPRSCSHRSPQLVNISFQGETLGRFSNHSCRCTALLWGKVVFIPGLHGTLDLDFV